MLRTSSRKGSGRPSGAKTTVRGGRDSGRSVQARSSEERTPPFSMAASMRTAPGARRVTARVVEPGASSVAAGISRGTACTVSPAVRRRTTPVGRSALEIRRTKTRALAGSEGSRDAVRATMPALMPGGTSEGLVVMISPDQRGNAAGVRSPASVKIHRVGSGGVSADSSSRPARSSRAVRAARRASGSSGWSVGWMERMPARAASMERVGATTMRGSRAARTTAISGEPEPRRRLERRSAAWALARSRRVVLPGASRADMEAEASMTTMRRPGMRSAEPSTGRAMAPASSRTARAWSRKSQVRRGARKGMLTSRSRTASRQSRVEETRTGRRRSLRACRASSTPRPSAPASRPARGARKVTGSSPRAGAGASRCRSGRGWGSEGGGTFCTRCRSRGRPRGWRRA